MSDTRVKVKLPKDKAAQLNKSGIKSIIRRSHENEIRLADPTSFFDKISKPVESRLYNWIKEVESSQEEMLDLNGSSKIVEVDVVTGKWRWRDIKSTKELREVLKTSEKSYSAFMKLRENNLKRYLSKRAKEDDYGGYGFADDSYASGGSLGSFPNRSEFTPLIGTPFFKQLYLQDYWEMHSKCFWYSNYSGIAKFIVDVTRNFVMGRGFSVSFKDQKAQDAWNRYEERSNIQEESRNWCDELTKFGENMLMKTFTPNGILHKSFDPSTIWEIVTDPENISDVKYYHQQYSTQYQLFSATGAPITKYIIKQLPPELVHHTKINVTSYEKRGRSDLLSPLLYFKYYEDYTQAKLIRAKNEAAFIWDVSIDGSDEDVQAYISSTQSIVDVPPGSENVHNKAITRTALSPTFGKAGADQIAQDILSYVAMSVTIPVTYFGTSATAGGTKAGALVSTEPVAKKMAERQLKMEHLIRRVVKDVLYDAGLDSNQEFEVNFPELMEEDRTAKIQDLVVAKQEGVISHRRMSEMISKEMRITKYDYESEQSDIEGEARNPNMFDIPDDQDLTKPEDDMQNNNERKLDRATIKKDNLSY